MCTLWSTFGHRLNNFSHLFGVLWSSLVAFWSPLGAFWSPSGALWSTLARLLVATGTLWAPSGRFWAPLGLHCRLGEGGGGGTVSTPLFPEGSDGDFDW